MNKFEKQNDFSSMFLVPKRMYKILTNIIDNYEKEELNQINYEPDNKNYIENAIRFKNKQNEQESKIASNKNLKNGIEKQYTDTTEQDKTETTENNKSSNFYYSLSDTAPTESKQLKEKDNILSNISPIRVRHGKKARRPLPYTSTPKIKKTIDKTATPFISAPIKKSVSFAPQSEKPVKKNLKRTLSLTNIKPYNERKKRTKIDTLNESNEKNESSEWKSSPITKALKNRNRDGKYVCPFKKCGKQYPSYQVFTTHMLKVHAAQMSVTDKSTISNLPGISSKQQKQKKLPISNTLAVKTPSGRRVCPVSQCRKQYTSINMLASHLMKEHTNRISIKDKSAISQIEKSQISHSKRKLTYPKLNI